MISRAAKNRKRMIVSIKSVVMKLAADLQIDPTSRDYVLKRLTYEGPSFVTRTLPLFAKFTLTCVTKGFIPKELKHELTNFEWTRSSPRFLRGLLADAIAGSADALFRIRQFCEYFYKTAFGFEKSELVAAEDKYLRTDDSIGDRGTIDWAHVERGRKAMFELFPRLCSANPVDIWSAGIMKDGPGSFARSELTEQVFGCTFEEFKKLPTADTGSHPVEFEGFKGYYKAYPSSREKLVGVHVDRVADLRFVPKDSRGPRTISKEPYHLLKGQMVFMDWCTHTLQKESRYRINFDDQTVNQTLALRSSIDGSMATLDLKDASDRVSLNVVKALTSHMSGLGYFLTKMRSTHVRLPSGEIRRLNKFANMGSGLCFPLLALVVYIAAVLGVREYGGRSIKSAASSVYVYGDDVIVPTETVFSVISSFERFGLLVNTSKSFFEGHFRESCGGDYYHGKDVSPVRLKLAAEKLDTIKVNYRNCYVPVKSDGGILQMERHCRELVDKGLFALARYYYRLLEARLGPLPTVARCSPVLGRYSLTALPKDIPQNGYVPTVKKKRTLAACGFKGLGRAFRSRWGLGEDFCLTPLRHEVVLKRTVAEPSTLYMWGLATDPRALIKL